MNPESAANKLKRSHELGLAFGKIACLPQSEWAKHAEPLIGNHSKQTVEEAILDFLPWMAAKNRRLTLAVDPRQCDKSGLACVVGAIRLREPGYHLAERYLCATLLEELRRDDNTSANALARLSSEPLGKSAAYEVWMAILTILNPRPIQLPEDAEPLPPDVANMIVELHVPTSKEVRQLTAHNPDYPALQHLEQRRWSDVWDDSGARDWIRMSKGGRPRKSGG